MSEKRPKTGWQLLLWNIRKTCPKCGKCGTVGRRFGFRWYRARMYYQSWCIGCR